MNSSMQLLLIQIIIMVVLTIIIIILARQNISIKYEKRIGRYSIEPLKDDSISFFDYISYGYLKFVRRKRKYFRKVKLLNKIAKKYEKYTDTFLQYDIKAIDFIVHKIIIGLSFVLLTIFSLVLQLRVISIFEFVLYFILGYYILDIYLIYKEKQRKKRIESQMLKAVIIMNNAFKAGKSTIQAVQIASIELSEPLSIEFKKIYNDMKYGLSVDVVFDRFAKRINIEEARYLSSSLTILNKTGGNIIHVFTSIEKTLFDKKKLEEELKNLTISSNMIVKVLLFIPFIFTMIIYFLNPNYFDPMFASPLGLLTLIFTVLIFIIYIFFLQRIMKVKV